MKAIIIATLLAAIAGLPVNAQNAEQDDQQDAQQDAAQNNAPENKTTAAEPTANQPKAPNTLPNNSKPVKVQSLRKNSEIAGESVRVENKKWVSNDKIVLRQYVQQPPLIPHSIDNYSITINANQCLSCHSWEAAQYTKATKVSLTHFKNRDGNELSDVSPSRYFCTQCHVPQMDAEPLIENGYQKANEVNSASE